MLTSMPGRLPAAVLATGLCLALAGCGGAAGAAGTAPAVTATLGPARTLPAGYFGTNYDYGGASTYVHDTDVAGQLGALGPGTLRWPAGTGANYFQWQLGHPVAVSSGGTGECAPPPEQEVDGFTFTLADLAAADRSTGADPIFDLNVMSAPLSSQIAMLRAAAADGIPVKYLELGNEFYLCETDYVHAFPTAQDYGRTVAADVATLHRDFPGAQVAAVGSAADKTSRAAGWNAGLLATATGAGKPDAITLHDHPSFPDSITTANLPTLFTEPYTSAATLATVTGTLSGLPVWITEYSLSEHSPGHLTYANALFEDEAALLLAKTVDHATLVDYWSSFGPNDNYAYRGNPVALTPVGLAMTWLDKAAQAARGATTMRPLVFSGAPTLGSGGDPALVGASFGTGELLINLSGRRLTVSSSAAIPAGRSYQQVTGDPTSEIQAASQLTASRGTVGSSIVLGPYSLTLID